MKIRESGFTLIEVMTVVVVIGILVAVALPSYQDHIRKGKRAEGKGALLKAAQLQERYFSDRNAYAGPADLSTLFGAGVNIYSGENPNNAGSAYRIVVVLGAGSTSYTLTAIPTASHNDPDVGGCGTLSLTSTGSRGKIGDKPMSQCW